MTEVREGLQRVSAGLVTVLHSHYRALGVLGPGGEGREH